VGGHLTAIANLLRDLRAYKQVIKRAVYSHPAGLGVHLLQIKLLLQSYSHQSAVSLNVFAIVTEQRAGYEFNSRRGRALFNPESRSALGYTQQQVQTAPELRSLGVKRPGQGVWLPAHLQPRRTLRKIGASPPLPST
jgi:hypothetical protein